MKYSLSFWGFFGKSVLVYLAFFPLHFVSAQILMSSGTYSQDFDSLAISGSGNVWMDNLTLPGWYAAKSVAPTAITSYRADDGSGTAGALYSFGTIGSSERALGSIASGTPQDLAYGVCFTNDTGSAVTNIVISYTGEQWRNANGSTAVTNVLAFSYQVSASPLTDADAANSQIWTDFSALDFNSPVVSTSSGVALNGDDNANRQLFLSVPLAGVEVQPGQKIFLRWRDKNDGGSDAGMAIDDLAVSFNASEISSNPPTILSQPTDTTATAGDTVSFSLMVNGSPPLSFQWLSNSVPVAGATNATLTLANVTTNMTGSTFFATVTNVFGSTNSDIATLTVVPETLMTGTTNSSITLMTYNVKGNGATDWSTNTAQVQAIGREIIYLNPDIIAFNEIPYSQTGEMVYWVEAFMPGFYLAMNSGTDGYIRSVIASRFPIVRSQKWLDGADLDPFGYASANFTRDLFEAEIDIPGWAQNLHVFTTHLKSSSGGYADAAAKRAAEAAAITNFFATVFFPQYPYSPFTLSGDMNESDTNTTAIRELVSSPTTLQLTDPENPYTGSINTYSIQGSLTERIDYIFPCALLFSNIIRSEVFRTDQLPAPLPPNLYSDDDKTASDHLPVLTTFANPFAQPFSVTAFSHSNQTVNLTWAAVPGGVYRVECSTNLINWTSVGTNVMTTNYLGVFSTNASEQIKFFRVHTK